MPIFVHILAHVHVFVLKSKEEDKYQESIQLHVTGTPDPVHHMGK